MDKISLFGAGFIGRKYAETYPDDVVVVDRHVCDSPLSNILFFRSTVHNYHPKEYNPYIDVETNLLHFLRVLDLNHKVFNTNLVFNLISTWFVYGNTELPAKETSPCNPTGFYSITARAREQLLISYCQTFGLNYRIIRLGNVIGVGDTKIGLKKNALQYFIRELAQGRDIECYKKGSIRDYIDVRDVVRAIHLILAKGEFNEIYNVANGRGLNVKNLIQHAWVTSGYKSKINEVEVPEFHHIVQTQDMWLNVQKINDLGYVKQHDIYAAIEELVYHYQHEA